MKPTIAAKLQGLYAITPATHSTTSMLTNSVEQAILGGAKLIQYRDKSSDQAHRAEQAHALLQLCRRFRVPLIINDDLALAKQINADGVHIGQHDASLAEARAELGQTAIIGYSCYNLLERATWAQAHGASYVAFGRFFCSSTKPDAVAADLALLQQARAALSLPIIAIGGILPEHVTQLRLAGADMVAVIHGVFGQTRPRSAAENYLKAFYEDVPNSAKDPFQ